MCDRTGHASSHWARPLLPGGGRVGFRVAREADASWKLLACRGSAPHGPSPRRPGRPPQRLPHRQRSRPGLQVFLGAVKFYDSVRCVLLSYSYRKQPLLFIKGYLTLGRMRENASSIHFMTRGLNGIRKGADLLQA